MVYRSSKMASHEEENMSSNNNNIKRYNLPRMIICNKEGENCGTDTESETHDGSASHNPSEILQILKREESRSEDEEGDDEEEGHKSSSTPPTSNQPSSQQPSTTLLAENLSELRLGNNNNIQGQEKGRPVLVPANAAGASSSPPLVSPERFSTETAQEQEEGDIPHIIEIEEKDELSSLYVGRIIGKGGEMIRDLQARSGCRIDVHQNVEAGQPRIITYRGKCQEDINFAKHLVSMLCNKKEGGEYINLPLGRATMKQIQVPKCVIGRIIGRGGEMIREVQSKSHARVQIDHSGQSGIDINHRQVTITGTEDAVVRAEEMIMFLSDNPDVDGHVMVRQHNWREVMPSHLDVPSHLHHTHHQGEVGHVVMTMPPPPSIQSDGSWDHLSQQMMTHNVGYPVSSSTSYGGLGRGYVNPYQQPQPQPIIEMETISCAKEDIGHIIGKKGVTINDLQRRSSCNIQIDQQNYQVSITGPRQGIELAKQMLYDILEHGVHHPYAGGRHTLEEQESSFDSVGYLEQQPSTTQTASFQPPQSPVQQQGGYPTNQYGVTYSYGGWQQHYPDPYAAAQQPPASPAQAVSSPWVVATAVDGRMYYYNTTTMESRWDKPAEMM